MIEVVREEDRRGGFEEFEQLIEKQLQLLEGVEKDGVIGVVRQGQSEERGEGKKEARKRLFWQSGQEIGRALVILHIFVHQICANMWKLQMCKGEEGME